MADEDSGADPTAQLVASQIRARASVDPSYVSRLFQIESGGNPNAVTGSNRGLGQFGPAEEAKYGLNDQNRTDPTAQTAAVLREAQEHSAKLRGTLGRDPTPGELYLTHQQGVAGGPALLSADPSAPAWQVIRPFYKSDAVAKKAITGNIPSTHPLYGADPDSVSAGDFRNLWVSKFERAPTPYSTAVASASPPAPQPSPSPAGPPLGGAGAPAGLLSGSSAAPSGEADMAQALSGSQGLLGNQAGQAGPEPIPFQPIAFPQPPGLALARMQNSMSGPRMALAQRLMAALRAPGQQG